MKTKFLIFLVFPIAFSEGTFRAVCSNDPSAVGCLDLYQWREKIHSQILAKNPIKNSEYFCDFIHLNFEGEQRLAKIIYAQLSKKWKFSDGQVIWLFGGSTTAGKECSPVSWGEILQTIVKTNENKSIIVKNFGINGGLANQSLGIIKHELKTLENAPDLILWDHWLNEVILARDPEDSSVAADGLVTLKKFLFTVNRGLEQHSYIFRYFLNHIRSLDFQFLTFVDQNTESPLDEGEENDKILWLGFNRIKSYGQSEEFRSHIFKTFDEISLLLKPTRTQLIILQMPYLDNYYRKTLPTLDKAIYEDLLPMIIDTNKKAADLHQWLFMDLRNLF